MLGTFNLDAGALGDDDFLRPHLCYARKILRSIDENRASSSYGYGNTVTVNELGQPHYAYTCYGFLDHVLTTTHPKALTELLSLQKTYLSDLPTSFDGKILPYHLVMLVERLLNATPWWSSIHDMTHIQEGDILAYMDEGYTLSMTPRPLHERTGTHVMMIDHVENMMEEDGRITLKLWIIDATRQPHNCHDSRYHKDKYERKSGVGRSPLIITHMPSCNTYHLQWSEQGKKHAKKISILRLFD